MSRRPVAPGGLAVLLLLGGPALAEPVVEIVEPSPGQALFGPRDVRIEVRSEEPVESVTVVFDGRQVAELRSPPWEVAIDAGQENREHRLEVIARTAGGAVGRSTLRFAAFRVDESLDLGLRQLYVTATRRGERLVDLRESELRLLDDGVVQEIVTLEGGEVPFAAVLIVDGSVSMRGEKLEAALAGARAFVRGMNAHDEARLLVASDRLHTVTPFVGPDGDLSDHLEGTVADGATTVHDDLFLGLESLEGRHGRKVVVLLSDGHDTLSALSMEEVRETARRRGAILYWLRLSRAGELVPRSTWRSPERAERDLELLRETVVESGGRVLDLGTSEQMGGSFREVLAELRAQIVIGYYPDPPGPTGEWREVEIEVGRRGVDLRAPRGYLDR